MEQSQPSNPGTADLQNAYIINPLWAGVFFILGGVLTVVIGVLVFLTTNASAASDQVFAVEALVGGLATDFLLRRYAHRRLVVGPKLTIPFAWIWPFLCLYVFIFQPLSQS